VDSRQILDSLYGTPARARTGWLRRFFRRGRSRRAVGWLRMRPSRRNQALVTGSLMLASAIVAHIYYYNRLVDLRCAVESTWAQVEAVQEQRANIQEGLTEIARQYLHYEQEVMTNVTALRTGAGAPTAAPTTAPAPALPPPIDPSRLGLGGLLARVRIVAEQYPELHLSQNLQQFSAALVANESQVAKAIMDHNDAVGRYTTLLAQFPANLFGHLAGFQPVTFYDPGDPATLGHRRIAF